MKKKREKMEEKKEKKRVRGKIRNLSRCIDLGQNSRIHVKNFPNKWESWKIYLKEEKDIEDVMEDNRKC